MSRPHAVRLLIAALAIVAIAHLGYQFRLGAEPADAGPFETVLARAVAGHFEPGAGPGRFYGPFGGDYPSVLMHAPLYYRLVALAAWPAVALGVDESSLADPLIRPSAPGRRVVPRPGVSFAFDVPLVGAGEIEGTLIDAAGKPVEGVDLELVGRSGAVVATARSDFDGYFLFESAVYGDYTLRIAKLSADAAELLPNLPGMARVGAATPTVRLGSVTATSARPRTIAISAD